MGIDTQLSRMARTLWSSPAVSLRVRWLESAYDPLRWESTPGRDSQLLDPRVEPARVRAMYTHPAFARRGVGRLILVLCETAAAAEGFTQLELMSTLSGEPLYTAYGFRPVESLTDATGGVPVPLIRMQKTVNPTPLS